MPNNVFEGIEEILKQQKEADERARQDKEEILNAINSANEKRASSVVQQTIDQRNASFSLKNFINRSVHEYMWIGTGEDFKKEKRLSIILILSSIFAMIISTIATTSSLGFYSTFTLFENIWLFLSFFVLAYTCKTKKNYLTLEYSLNSFEIFKTNSDGILISTVYKKKYKVFLVLGCIAFLFNALGIWLFESKAPLLITIIELLTMGIVIFTVYKVIDFFAAYGPIRFRGRNDSNTQIISIVWDKVENKLYTEQDYLKSHPYME